MLAKMFQRFGLLIGEQKRMTANAPMIFLAGLKQTLLDEGLSKILVGVTRHYRMFLVNVAGIGKAICLGFQDKTRPGISTDGDGEGRHSLNFLTQNSGAIKKMM